ncbi:hypothetical protein EAO68_02620 [Streptomyces sp. wa22]|nr:hypothetical protein EAO68_02620 [Streptomyces sp. wa22]
MDPLPLQGRGSAYARDAQRPEGQEARGETGRRQATSGNERQRVAWGDCWKDWRVLKVSEKCLTALSTFVGTLSTNVGNLSTQTNRWLPAARLSGT